MPSYIQGLSEVSARAAARCRDMIPFAGFGALTPGGRAALPGSRLELAIALSPEAQCPATSKV